MAMRGGEWGLIAACLAVLPMAQAQAQAPTQTDSTLVQPNPAAAIGRLPNGLRYAVMQRGVGGRMAISLYVAAGAFEEAEDQRGVANLLAHMAAPDPNGDPVQSVQADLFSTTYTVDIADAANGQPQKGLQWLRAMADGQAPTEAEVVAARIAIATEQERLNSDDAAIEAVALDFFMPQSRGRRRAPATLADGAETANAAKVAAFHRRWYRPDNAIVVMVGAASPAALQAQIAATFGSWRAVGRPAPAASLIRPLDRARPLEAKAVSGADMTGSIQVCRMSPSAPAQPESVAVWHGRLADEAWVFALQTRLRRAARGATAPEGQVDAGLQSDVHLRIDEACARAARPDQDWRDDLKTVENETRRLSLYGVTDEELARFKAARHASLAAGPAIAIRAAPTDIAAIMIENLVSGDTYSTAQEDQRVQGAALDGLDKAAVDAAFARHWTQAGQPLIFVTAADQTEEDDIKAAWKRAQGEALDRPPAHTPEEAAPSTAPEGAVVAAVIVRSAPG
jgi:zinc protease